MYYLLERNTTTGEFVTNFTMYGTTPEDILDRVFRDKLYIRDLTNESPCAMLFVHLTTGKEIGIIFSTV